MVGNSFGAFGYNSLWPCSDVEACPGTVLGHLNGRSHTPVPGSISVYKELLGKVITIKKSAENLEL